MIQITYYYSASVAAIAVVFIKLIMGKEFDCINVLNTIGHNELVDSLYYVKFSVGLFFLYVGIGL